MPYIYAQSKIASEKGLPMLRALFAEFPNDPGAWLVDNHYILGSDILVAPFFEAAKTRSVYLPKGQWIDYQTRKLYAGGWYEIASGELEVVMLVREGAVLPHVKVAQSIGNIDWKNTELVNFAFTSDRALVQICLPSDNLVKEVLLTKKGKKFVVSQDPFAGIISWKLL